MTRESNMTELKEREAFEAAYRKEFPVSCECSPDKFARFGDTYENLQVLAAWRMWQVSRSAAILAAPGAPTPDPWRKDPRNFGAAEFAGAPAPVAPTEPDMRAICEALGFDPTNHHNAAKCPYCRSQATAPVAPTDDARIAFERDALTRYPGLTLPRKDDGYINPSWDWEWRFWLRAWNASASRLPPPVAVTPDDIRAQGWAVAVHNDYRLNGEPHTFWLFTKGDACVKGEGRTDAEALNIVRAALAAPISPAPAAELMEQPMAPELTDDERTLLYCASCVFSIPPYDKNPQSKKIMQLLTWLSRVRPAPPLAGQDLRGSSDGSIEGGEQQ